MRRSRRARSEMRPIESLLPTTLLRAPVPCLFPGPSSPTLRRACTRRVAARRAGDESVSRRSTSLRRIAMTSWGRCLPPTRHGDRASDASVAGLRSIPVRASSRCAKIHRFGEGRRDRFHLAVVTRRGFSRSKAPSEGRRCAARLPASRPAIAHLSSPGFRRGSLRGVFSGPARAVVATNASCGFVWLFVAAGSSRHVGSTHREASHAPRAIG